MLMSCAMTGPRQPDADSLTLSRSERVAGVAVHLFTAAGAGLGLLALTAAIDRRFALCFAWLGAALVVDGLDGALARRARVSETAPFIDGALLDLVVDYLTYVIVPLIALWRSDLMPHGLALACALVVAIGSALYFADKRMKTPDLWFRGLPGCWNIVALYLFAFRLPATMTAAILLGGTALMFAPIVCVHPLRVTRYRGLTLAISLLWLACAGAAILRSFAPTPLANWGLGLSGLYFIGLSVWRGRPNSGSHSPQASC